MRISPSSMRSTPERIFISVDFPAPFRQAGHVPCLFARRSHALERAHFPAEGAVGFFDAPHLQISRHKSQFLPKIVQSQRPFPQARRILSNRRARVNGSVDQTLISRLHFFQNVRGYGGLVTGSSR
jgi:hypothetical protein